MAAAAAVATTENRSKSSNFNVREKTMQRSLTCGGNFLAGCDEDQQPSFPCRQSLLTAVVQVGGGGSEMAAAVTIGRSPVSGRRCLRAAVRSYDDHIDPGGVLFAWYEERLISISGHSRLKRRQEH